MKLRVVELLLVTTLPVMILAERGVPDPFTILWTLLGGTMSAGAANAFNMVIDRDIDRVMSRTRKRPLVTGDLSVRQALVFAFALTVLSTVVLGFGTNWLAAALALTAIAFYVFVYTLWLKRRTEQNIIWGGIAGCFPVLIGWAAVTGSLDWPPLVFFGVVFCWQMPHFWALAMRFREDYARAGVPMLPVVAPALSVGRQSAVWAWLTVAVSLLLWPLGSEFGIGLLYTACAAALGAWFVLEAHRLLGRIRREADPKPMKLFHVSISYLALLSIAIIVDVLI
jgi:heme o synthase